MNRARAGQTWPAGAAEAAVPEPRWDLYHAVVFAAVVVIVQVGPISLPGRIAASLALAAMVPWYVLIGRPLMEADDSPWINGVSWRALIYLAVLVALFGVVQSQDANAWFLAFGLSPHCFQVVPPRWGMASVVVLNVLAGALTAAAHPGLTGDLTAAGIVVFVVAFSYVYSRWTIQVIQRSRERAELIAALESTRAELAAAHHEAGVLAERHRLAGEIHDTLAQGFASIVTLLQAAGAGHEPTEAADSTRHHLDLALVTARENLTEARRLIAALSPASLAAGTLGDGVRQVTDSAGAQAGISARAEVTGAERRLPTAAEVVLLRVCQEALANVRQHAAAQHVSVRLDYAEDAVRLTVADDGRGFVPEQAAGGFGLPGMRDRVRQVGGAVRVRSAPGAGTEVSAEVPG